MLKFNVTFQPQNKTIQVKQGLTVLEAALQHGVGLNASCGGAGTCGKCVVKVISGENRPTEQDVKVLGAKKTDKGFRLACKTTISSDMEVHVPAGSHHSGSHSIITHDADTARHLSPLLIKKYISEADVTFVTYGESQLTVEDGDTAAKCFGAAFDIGTTTLVGTLVDLVDGKDLAVASMVNPQTAFGDDVISRVKKCREDSDGLDRLHSAIIGAVNKLLAELYEKTGVRPENVYQAVFAGNTAMQEILCNINPRALGEIPFQPEFLEMQFLSTAKVGVDINRDGIVNVFPNIGGFVGGDTVSGVVAARLEDQKVPSLLIDIGTNGEIVLSGKDGMLAASMAAGPAFEGARIISGMRAAEGAISAFSIKDKVSYKTIGEKKAKGICGSGLIDIVASLLNAGVVDQYGRIVDADELPAGVPDFIKQRLTSDKDQPAFLLADAVDAEHGEPLFIYQKDIRELQLAAAAIRAGIRILLAQQGYTSEDLSTVYVAGAFGNFIDVASAKRIGLLPQVSLKKMKFIGNSSSLGAKKVLLSGRESLYARDLSAKIKHYDLSQSPAFQDEFAESMIFPE